MKSDYRKAVADKTTVGLRVKSILEAGQLVDDGTVLSLVSEAISSSPQMKSQGFVLDGYPRNLNQANQLQTLLAEKQLGLNAALCLDVSDEVLIDRICSTLLCGSCLFFAFSLAFFTPNTILTAPWL